MKKTLTIISILLLSALVAFCWVRIEEKIIKTNYPLEYKQIVEQNAKEYSVPKQLIYAVIKVESDFKSDAQSHKGAVGLMQLMPSTYEWLYEKDTGTKGQSDLLYKPEVNIKYGAFYLDWLYSKYQSWETAVAAYNAGHGRVDEWLESRDYSDMDGNLTNIPYKETREYVQKVMAAMEIYEKTYFDNKQR